MKRVLVSSFSVPNSIVVSLVLLCVFAFAGCSHPSISAENSSTASALAPAPAELPAVYKCVVERIGDYESGDYHYVSVKCKDADEIARYYMDPLWNLVKPGDVVIMTPSHDGRRVVWDTSVYFAEFPETRVMAK
jgi:hypothetical protein